MTAVGALWQRLDARRRDALLCGVLLCLGLALALPQLWRPIQWNPDALFYQAQTRELLGESRSDALHHVFASELAARSDAGEQHLPPRLRYTDNPVWVDYSSRFYRRRWTVPAMAAALTPLAGDNSLEDVSLLGLVLVAPLAYLLLRARCGRPASLAAAAFCELLPPLSSLAPHPNVDAWGLALLFAALLIAQRGVADRGPRWLPVWVLSILALSFTRDAAVVALSAVAWLAFRERSRLMLVTTLTGVIAALPAPIIFSAPLRENLAYVMNNFRIPADTRWSSILHKYPSQLWKVVEEDLRYPKTAADPVLAFAMGAVVVAGLAVLLFARHRGGSLSVLARGSLVGAAATILVSVNITGLRLELAFVPAVAVGVALLVELILEQRGERAAGFAESSPPGLGPAQRSELS